MAKKKQEVKKPQTFTEWLSMTQAAEANKDRMLSQDYRKLMEGIGPMVVPSQPVPEYNSGAVTSVVNNYLSSIKDIDLGTYDFSTTELQFNPITAQQVNAEKAVGDAFKYNQQMIGQYGAMAQQMTDIDIKNRERQLDEFVPGWRESTDKMRVINESFMRGEVPRDVANQLQQSAAYITAMGGGSAQQMGAVTARSLGATSLQLAQQGMEGTKSYMQMMQQLMPEQTTTGQIMASQGMNAQMAVQTAIQNAEAKLRGDIATSTGQLQAAETSQRLRLAGQQAEAGLATARAGLLSEAYGTALQTKTGNIYNQFMADLIKSNILGQTQETAFKEWGERTGLTAGERRGIGFGL